MMYLPTEPNTVAARFWAKVEADLVMDHVRERGCTHRHCVNPAHLEPVSFEENVRRGNFDKNHQHTKTVCPAGHPYSETNTRMHGPGGAWRRCIECDRISSQACRDRRKARAAALVAGSGSPSAVGNRPATSGGAVGRPFGEVRPAATPPTSEFGPGRVLQLLLGGRP